MKTCTKCGESLHHDNFYANPGNGDGYHARCKGCMRAARAGKVTRESIIDRAVGRTESMIAEHRGDAPPPAKPIKPPTRVKYINGGWLYPPKPDASHAALEEFWTKFHIHFCAASARDRIPLYLFVGVPIPDVLDVLSSPELHASIARYSHGYGARGWGMKFAWGELPETAPSI